MKAALYCRLSEEDRNKVSHREDSASIQNQKAMLTRYAAAQGWNVHDIYSDEDFSGTDRSRPEFNRLILDARAGKFDIILCKSQSRFTRELELVEKYIHGLFPRLGIRFVSLVDNADTSSKGNKKARQINGLVNEWYLEDMSENIRSVLTSRREQGFHIGAFAPYGYRKDPRKKGHLIIDPEAAQTVAKIYRLFLEGHGKLAIARILNREGIPNPTEYKRLQGLIRNSHIRHSPLWSYSTVTGILTNEVYIGNMVQGKTGSDSWKTRQKVTHPRDQWIFVPGTHAPIISRETWNRVQALIAQKATPAQPAPEGIFARKLYCLHCGARLCSLKSGEKRRFACPRHRLSGDACVGSGISLGKLLGLVSAELVTLSRELSHREKMPVLPDCDSFQLPGDPALAKHMVNTLIDSVFVGKRDPVTKITPVEIHWNF